MLFAHSLSVNTAFAPISPAPNASDPSPIQKSADAGSNFGATLETSLAAVTAPAQAGAGQAKGVGSAMATGNAGKSPAPARGTKKDELEASAPAGTEAKPSLLAVLVVPAPVLPQVPDAIPVQTAVPAPGAGSSAVTGENTPAPSAAGGVSTGLPAGFALKGRASLDAQAGPQAGAVGFTLPSGGAPGIVGARNAAGQNVQAIQGEKPVSAHPVPPEAPTPPVQAASSKSENGGNAASVLPGTAVNAAAQEGLTQAVQSSPAVSAVKGAATPSGSSQPVTPLAGVSAANGTANLHPSQSSAVPAVAHPQQGAASSGNTNSGTGAGTPSKDRATSDAGVAAAGPVAANGFASAVAVGAGAASVLPASVSHGSGAAGTPNGGTGLPQAPVSATLQDAVTSPIHTARVLETVGGTEIRLGLRSSEFGSISIATSVSSGSLQAQIAVDHTALGGALGRALAVHLPAIEEKLGSSLGVPARIEVRDAGAGSSGNPAHSFQGGSRGGRENGPASSGFSNDSSSIAAVRVEAVTPALAAATTPSSTRLSVLA